MNIRNVLIAIFAAVFALPALGNGPMPSDTGMSNSNTSNVSPGRKKWIRKRIRELRPGIDSYRSAERTSQGIDRILGAADNNGVRVAFPQGQSSEEHWKYMKARFEFLALKAEVGRANAKDMAELRALQHALVR